MLHYYGELLNFLTRLIGNRDTACEVAQESYARVLNAQRENRPIQNPRAFLYQTARNLVADNHRAFSRFPLEEKEEECLAPGYEQPEAALFSELRQKALMKTIAALPPRCKEAFWMHRIEGRSQAEVAGKMGISINMVQKHIIRATLACRECMDRFEKGEA